MRLLATLPREQDSTSYTGPLRIPAASPSGCAVSGQRFPVDRTPLLVRHAQRPTNPLGLRGGPRQTGVRPSGPSQSDSSLPGRLESGTLRDQRIPSGSAEVRARLESDRRDLPSPTPRYPEGWNLAGTRWVRIRQEPLRPGAGIRQEPLRPGAGIRFGRSRFGRGPDSLRQEPLRPGAGIVATGAASARGRYRCGRNRFGRGPISLRQEPLRPGAGIVAAGTASAGGRYRCDRRCFGQGPHKLLCSHVSAWG